MGIGVRAQSTTTAAAGGLPSGKSQSQKCLAPGFSNPSPLSGPPRGCVSCTRGLALSPSLQYPLVLAVQLHGSMEPPGTYPQHPNRGASTVFTSLVPHLLGGDTWQR